MSSKTRRLRIALIAVLVTTLLGLLAPVLPAGAVALTVTKNTATVDFPNKLAFALVADAPQPVTDAEVWYHPVYSPITLVSRADFSGGTHVDTSASVDMQLHYLPPGLDIVYRWRLTLQDGTVLETPEKTVLYMDNRNQWSTATSGPVTIFYQKGDDQIGQEALKTVVQSINQFDQTFHITSKDDVHIVIYGSGSAFASALPPNSAEWIGGIAEPDLHLVLTGISPGPDAMSEVHRVLSHEVVHLITGQATENPFNTPPPWLDEGLATYYQAVKDSRFGPALQNAVKSGQLIPVKALNSSFPDDPNQALLSYAESESIVTFILKEKGADKMSALIQAFKGGVSYDQAVEQGLGESIDQLDQEWKLWLGYEGDKKQTASTGNDSGGPGIGQGIGDVLGASTSTLLIALAALLCVATGAYLTLRSRRSSDETS